MLELAPQREASDSRSTRLLLVGVEANLRRLLAPSYEILEAASDAEALQMARSHRPDALLCGSAMPDLDGCALCRALKADPEANYIPAMLLESRPDSMSRIQALESGADAYLGYPWPAAELLLRLRNLLRACARLKAHFVSQSSQPSREPSLFPLPSQEPNSYNRMQDAL